jgi:NADPH:quinone reductase-like Zn-dependent oxidoreductase
MKAIRFNQHGEPVKVLAVEERTAPEQGQGEVRVRIMASPVNPSDLLYVRGHYAGVEANFPAPAGFEGVGIVETFGPQVRVNRPHGTLGPVLGPRSGREQRGGQLGRIFRGARTRHIPAVPSGE